MEHQITLVLRIAEMAETVHAEGVAHTYRCVVFSGLHTMQRNQAVLRIYEMRDQGLKQDDAQWHTVSPQYER